MELFGVATKDKKPVKNWKEADKLTVEEIKKILQENGEFAIRTGLQPNGLAIGVIDIDTIDHKAVKDIVDIIGVENMGKFVQMESKSGKPHLYFWYKPEDRQGDKGIGYMLNSYIDGGRVELFLSDHLITLYRKKENLQELISNVDPVSKDVLNRLEKAFEIDKKEEVREMSNLAFNRFTGDCEAILKIIKDLYNEGDITGIDVDYALASMVALKGCSKDIFKQFWQEKYNERETNYILTRTERHPNPFTYRSVLKLAKEKGYKVPSYLNQLDHEAVAKDIIQKEQLLKVNGELYRNNKGLLVPFKVNEQFVKDFLLKYYGVRDSYILGAVVSALKDFLDHIKRYELDYDMSYRKDTQFLIEIEGKLYPCELDGDKGKVKVYKKPNSLWEELHGLNGEKNPLEVIPEIPDKLVEAIPDPNAWRYLFVWLAAKIHFGHLPFVYTLSTVQGTGKTSIIGWLVKQIFEEHTLIKDFSSFAHSNFDSIDEFTEVLILEETKVVQNSPAYYKLKTLTGDDRIVVNRKYSKEKTINNHTGVICFSNDDMPLKIEDANDRRFLLFIVEDSKKLDIDFEELQELRQALLKAFYEWKAQVDYKKAWKILEEYATGENQRELKREIYKESSPVAIVEEITEEDINRFIHVYYKNDIDRVKAEAEVEKWKEKGIVKTGFIIALINFLNNTRLSPQFIGRKLKTLGYEQIKKHDGRYWTIPFPGGENEEEIEL